MISLSSPGAVGPDQWCHSLTIKHCTCLNFAFTLGVWTSLVRGPLIAASRPDPTPTWPSTALEFASGTYGWGWAHLITEVGIHREEGAGGRQLQFFLVMSYMSSELSSHPVCLEKHLVSDIYAQWGDLPCYGTVVILSSSSASPLSELSCLSSSARRPKPHITSASDKHQSQIQGHHWESDVPHKVDKEP